MGAFQDRLDKPHVEAATCWGDVADTGNDGDGEQILVFGKAELNEMYAMDGGTLNLVMDGSPAIFDVGSSEKGIEQCPAEVEPGRSW